MTLSVIAPPLIQAGDRREILLGSPGPVDELVQVGRPKPEPDARDTVENDPPSRAEAIQAARMDLQDLGRLPDCHQAICVRCHSFLLTVYGLLHKP